MATPTSWNRAREEAWRNAFPGATAEACIATIDEVMRSIGDTSPDCDAVVRETIRSLDKVALTCVVLTSREHLIALEARDKRRHRIF
jgi:hypothetical protein